MDMKNMVVWMPAGIEWVSGVAVVILARTKLNMLLNAASPVLLVFALIALIPLPPLVHMGIVLMIIWSVHIRTITPRHLRGAPCSWK